MVSLLPESSRLIRDQPTLSKSIPKYIPSKFFYGMCKVLVIQLIGVPYGTSKLTQKLKTWPSVLSRLAALNAVSFCFCAEIIFHKLLIDSEVISVKYNSKCSINECSNLNNYKVNWNIYPLLKSVFKDRHIFETINTVATI